MSCAPPLADATAKALEDDDVAAQVAITIEDLPAAHFTALAGLGRPGSSTEGAAPETLRLYAYAYRYFLGALQRSAPGLLALSPACALASGLPFYRDDILARKTDRDARLAEFAMFTSAAQAIAPGIDREHLRRYRHELSRTASATGGRFARATEGTGDRAQYALTREQLGARDRGLIDDYLAKDAMVDGTARRNGLRHEYQLRMLLGTVSRHAPHLLDAADEVRFGPATIETLVADLVISGRPETVASRLRQLRDALRRILPDFDSRHFLAIARAHRQQLIKDGLVARPAPEAEMLPATLLPKRLMRHIEGCLSSKARATRLFGQRLRTEVQGSSSPHWRNIACWKLGLRASTVKLIMHALQSWAGFLQRRHPERLRGSLLLRYTPALVEEFIAELRVSCVDRTIAMRLDALRRLAFRCGRRMASLDWLRLRARALRADVPPQRIWTSSLRPRQIFRTAMEAFEDARCKLEILRTGGYPVCSPRILAERMRDSLIVAFEALLILRVRNLAGLELTSRMRKIGDRYKLFFEGSDMKAGRVHRVNLPHRLTAAMDCYIEHVRPALHPRHDPSALWVSVQTGSSLTVSGIQKIVPKIMLDLLGESVSTHRFRHIGQTAAATLRSLHETLPMKLAGHGSAFIGERFYIAPRLNDNEPARRVRDHIGGLIMAVFEAEGMNRLTEDSLVH